MTKKLPSFDRLKDVFFSAIKTIIELLLRASGINAGFIIKTTR